MDETVNHRIKRLRKELKLTQHEFSSVISISPGQLACIETEKRGVNDRTIKLICDSFDVNREWLKTGEGSAHAGDKHAANKRLVALFDTLKPMYRDFIMDSMNFFIRIQAQE